MTGRILYTNIRLLYKHLALVRTFSVFPCPITGNDYLCVISQLWPNDAFVQPLYIVPLARFTIFHLIMKQLNMPLAASTHCPEGFALLCIITPKSISSLITLYTTKAHKTMILRASKDLMTTLHYLNTDS